MRTCSFSVHLASPSQALYTGKECSGNVGVGEVVAGKASGAERFDKHPSLKLVPAAFDVNGVQIWIENLTRGCGILVVTFDLPSSRNIDRSGDKSLIVHPHISLENHCEMRFLVSEKD